MNVYRLICIALLAMAPVSVAASNEDDATEPGPRTISTDSSENGLR